MSLMFGAGRSNESLDSVSTPVRNRTPDGSAEQLIWDDLAPSDSEGENDSADILHASFSSPHRHSHIGALYEHQLAAEVSQGNAEVGVTGLERIDVSASGSLSHRARVRQRMSRLVDLYGLITESKYLGDDGLSDELNSLVEIIHDSSKKQADGFRLSPASEGFAEILLCEIALKNRDRFGLLWGNILGAHYNSRLTFRPSRVGDERSGGEETIKLTPGIEKCVTGLLRLCIWSTSRNAILNQVLPTLDILHPPLGALVWSPLELNLDKHLAEGLWRICRNIDGLSQINNQGYSGILGLVEWCATRGGIVHPGCVVEDDPSLQAFRSLHLILHSPELKDTVPYECVKAIRCLVEAGERASAPKLSVAGLDLLQVLHTKMELLATKEDPDRLLKCWLPTLTAISEPAEKSRNASVRQQAISLLTDTLLDRHSSSVPVTSLYRIINDICIPLAGDRITDLLRIPEGATDLDETLIELELCISLLFKPFLHHLKALVSVQQEFIAVWTSMLGIMTQLLGEGSSDQDEEADESEGVSTRENLFQRTKELGTMHLRNAVMVLAAMGVLGEEDGRETKEVGVNVMDGNEHDISSVTWAAIASIGYCKPHLEEWKNAIAINPS